MVRRAPDPHPASHAEKWLSALGGGAGILAVVAISHALLDASHLPWMVASMGASAVLLFAVPHSPLAQPWPVLGGHLLSGSIGVTCALLVDDALAASALAVGLSVATMYYGRCLHPPGGATALTAVLGGPSVHALGYAWLATPLLLNVLVLLGVAMLFNAPFGHRRYPLAWAWPGHPPAPAGADTEEELMITHGDLVHALTEIDSFIDVTEEDLLRIYRLATQRARMAVSSEAYMVDGQA